MQTTDQILLLENAAAANMAVAQGLRALCERQDLLEVLAGPKQAARAPAKPNLLGNPATKSIGRNLTIPIEDPVEWERSIYDILLLFSQITRSVSTILGILK